MIVINTSDSFPLSLAPKTETDAKVQELYILINTILGECPLYRDFGISTEYMHMPVNAARTAFTMALTNAMEKYFPDMRLEGIRFEQSKTMNGFITPVLEVRDIE